MIKDSIRKVLNAGGKQMFDNVNNDKNPVIIDQLVDKFKLIYSNSKKKLNFN